MGQYLSICLRHSIDVDRKEAENAYGSYDEAIVKLTEWLGGNQELFFIKSTDNIISFALKPEIVMNHIVDLLNRFYELYYGYTDEEVIEKIEKCTNWDEVLELADRNCFEAFQEYHSYDYLYVNGRSIHYRMYTILLSVEGKIEMECYGKTFELLDRLLREKLSFNPLASLLTTIITD
ncbi:MAG: hypothetical protein K2L34_11605 [Muribaculaceae bacterium]|nr:hypothetical protein [Muribaculaceae bacterium]